MTVARKPQDRKPKAAAEDAFSFEHDGVTYTLPPLATVYARVPGRELRNAIMDGDEGQLRLAFSMLEKLEGAEDALDAIYDKPAPDMLEIVQKWMTYKPVNGVSLGE